jgi:hypothetical protein
MSDPGVLFSRYLQRWWDTQLSTVDDAAQWRGGRDVAALASEFRRDAQFELAQARFLHHRPKTEQARRLVSGLEPRPLEDDEDLLVEAIVQAGATAQRVRTTTAAGALLTVLALVIRNIVRRR